MSSDIETIEKLEAEFLTAVNDALDEPALDAVRVAALGKKGEISGMMKELGRMTPEERQTTGAALNRLKDEIDTALRARKQGLEDAALDARLKGEWLDVTLPGRPRPQGSIHPVSQVTEEIARTLTASVGLILAIPITTAIAASLAPVAPSRARSTYEDQKKAETES